MVTELFAEPMKIDAKFPLATCGLCRQLYQARSGRRFLRKAQGAGVRARLPRQGGLQARPGAGAGGAGGAGRAPRAAGGQRRGASGELLRAGHGPRAAGPPAAAAAAAAARGGRTLPAPLRLQPGRPALPAAPARGAPRARPRVSTAGRIGQSWGGDICCYVPGGAGGVPGTCCSASAPRVGGSTRTAEQRRLSRRPGHALCRRGGSFGESPIPLRGQDVV